MAKLPAAAVTYAGWFVASYLALHIYMWKLNDASRDRPQCACNCGSQMPSGAGAATQTNIPAAACGTGLFRLANEPFFQSLKAGAASFLGPTPFGTPVQKLLTGGDARWNSSHTSLFISPVNWRFIWAVLAPINFPYRPYPFSELELMIAAIGNSRPRMVFEWGTHVGVSALIWYEIRQFAGLDYQIHSYDLPPETRNVENPGSDRGFLVRDLPGVHLHLGDAVALSVQEWRARPQPSNEDVAFYFIDGAHNYETVFREASSVFKELGTQAHFLFHDTCCGPNQGLA